MSRTDLRDRTFRYAWLLEISGLTTRLYSGQRPPAASIGWGGVTYTDLPVIQSVGSQTTRLNALGGIAEQGALTIILRAVQDADPEHDPAVFLLRNGHRAASRFVRLAATLEHDATAVDVVLNRDVSGWPTIGGREVLHCGVETLVAQGGTDVSPPRFIVADRARLGTRVAVHQVDLARGWQPYVTSDVVTWTGRRVVLKRAAITGAPLVAGDYEEVLRGFLDGPPSKAPDGTVKVVCLPLTVAAKTRVGGDAVRTGFVHDFHLFTRGLRSTVAHTQIFKAGDMMSQPNPNNDISGSGVVTVGSNRAMADNTDPTLPDGHPRRSAFQVTNAPVVPRMEASGAAPFATLNQIAVGAAEPAGNTNGGGYVENVDLYDVQAVDLCGGADEALLRWPQDVVAAVNTAWQPGTTAGAGGAWCDVRLNLNGDRPRLELLRNGQVIEGPLLVEFRSDWEEPGEFAEDYVEGQGYMRERREVLAMGLDFAAPDETQWPDVPSERAQWMQRWTRQISVKRSRDNGQASIAKEIRGVALGFLENGERHFLFKADVLGTAFSGVKWVQVKWTDPRGDEQKQIVPIVAVAAETYSGKLIGYRYTIGETVRQQVKTCGDWPGGPLAEVRAAAKWSRATGAQVILELLLSGRGAGTNSAAYDVQAFGANLNEDDIWLETFLAAPDIGTWSMPLAEEVEIGAFIQPILQAMGCCLAMVLDEETGRQRLALVPLGIEFAPDAGATIQQSHISGGVGEPTEAKITTAYKLELGYDEATGEARIKPTFADADAQADAGGDAGQTLELKLRGLDVGAVTDGAALALRLVSDMRARHGRPRVGYELLLYHGAAATAAIGRMVRLNLEAITAAARAMEVTVDHDKASARLVLMRYGVNGAGWAPALRVTAVVSAKIVEVAANQHTRPQHPITGHDQVDLDYWAVNDPCACVKRGQWSARVSTFITAIDTVTRRVTFDANHLLAVGDTVRPLAYDLSTAIQKGFLYVADADDHLGAGDDQAKDWM